MGISSLAGVLQVGTNRGAVVLNGGVTTEVISVPDISCAHCKSTIEQAVSELVGVERVDVDVTAKTVLVAYDQDRLSRHSILETIEDQGYSVSL